MRDERKELLCIRQSHGRLLFPQSLVMFISLWLQRRLVCLGLVKSILLGGKCLQKSLLSAFWDSHLKSKEYKYKNMKRIKQKHKANH